MSENGGSLGLISLVIAGIGLFFFGIILDPIAIIIGIVAVRKGEQKTLAYIAIIIGVAKILLVVLAVGAWFWIGSLATPPGELEGQTKQIGITIETCNTDKNQLLIRNTGTKTIQGKMNLLQGDSNQKIGQIKLKEIKPGKAKWRNTTANLKNNMEYEAKKKEYPNIPFKCGSKQENTKTTGDYNVVTFPINGNAWGYYGWGDCSDQTGSYEDIDQFCKCKGYQGALPKNKDPCYHDWAGDRSKWKPDTTNKNCISPTESTRGGTALTKIKCK